MDPVATLKALDDAMAARDREACGQAADALVGWVEKGGYLPVGPHGCDWRGHLTASQFTSLMRCIRHVAEMA